ncbi:MAG: GNAT family N-acetyltransferase [Pseudomonadales bacterium]|nr:GNAT family N-acetyltransferase [Pseudomonadales bacterium]MCP5185048.1 GNAT family N-acetyltransferase [Pseudomonadales bacterium]
MLPLVQAYWALEALDGFSEQRCGDALGRLLSNAALGCGFVATVDARVVGYLLQVYVFSLEHAGLTAEIDEFFLLPDFRSAGVGARLLTAAERAAAASGCANISLQAGVGNDRAVAFYARAGYRRREGYLLLEKDLPVRA